MLYRGRCALCLNRNRVEHAEILSHRGLQLRDSGGLPFTLANEGLSDHRQANAEDDEATSDERAHDVAGHTPSLALRPDVLRALLPASAAQRPYTRTALGIKLRTEKEKGPVGMFFRMFRADAAQQGAAGHAPGQSAYAAPGQAARTTAVNANHPTGADRRSGHRQPAKGVSAR